MSETATKALPWTLWGHQERAVDRIDAAWAKGVKSLVCACPTGGGKTILAIEAIRRERARGGRAMFVAPRHELIGQVSAKLDQWLPFSYGMIVASKKHALDLYAPMQVASVDTLVSRVLKRQNLQLPPTDLVVLDECHLYQTEHRNNLLKMFGDRARILGLTATPGRYDGRALAIQFEHMIAVATTRELTERGHLAPAVYFSPSVPDLERVKVTASEYNMKQVADRMAPLLGDIVEHWLRLAGDRRTVLFADCVAHSVWLAEKFRQYGVSAEHCDGSMETDHRDLVFARFRKGETQVLCNVDLATYGFDLPELDCVDLCRPTRSIVKYLQMIGRGLRAANGKRNCLVIDHSGNVHLHGKADEARYWSLEGERVIGGTVRKCGQRAKEHKYLTCPDCHAIFGGTLTCPDCGHFFEAAAKGFKVVEGELVEVGADSERGPTQLEKQVFYCELVGYLIKRNSLHPERVPWKIGWAAYTYKERFGVWPPKAWKSHQPRTPSIATERWVKHLMIRKAKSRRRSEAA